MTNPNLKDYWRGYRNAKVSVYLAGIEHCEQLDFKDSDSQFAQGFAAGLAKLSEDLIDMLRKEGKHDNKKQNTDTADYH